MAIWGQKHCVQNEGLNSIDIVTTSYWWLKIKDKKNNRTYLNICGNKALQLHQFQNFSLSFIYFWDNTMRRTYFLYHGERNIFSSSI